MNETALQQQCQKVILDNGGYVIKHHGGPHAVIGTPDLLACLPPRGRMLVVECKVGKNGPTTAQSLQLRLWREAGAIALTVHEDGPEVLAQVIDNERRLAS